MTAPTRLLLTLIPVKSALPAAVITFTIPENTVLITLDIDNNTCEIAFPAAVITFTIDWRICDIVLPSCCMS